MIRISRPVIAILAAVSAPIAQANVTLVSDGKPVCVVVTSDHPSAVVAYAAEELVGHLQKATGVLVEVIVESSLRPQMESRVFIGDSESVRAAGVATPTLAPEAFVLRTTGKALIIAGDDGRGDPLDSDTRAGTLWGVYEWLDRTLGIRWLWPGELGTYVPKTKTVIARDVDETIPPRFIQRRLRPGMGFESENPALGFTGKAFEQFKHEQTVFLRRHRMGRSQPMGYGHAFTDWWKRYGKEHPEWFQLLPGGKRGPNKPTSRFSMCVSNSELQKQIVANALGKGGHFVNACENDIPGNCTCEACQALDGPAPADYLKYYSPSSKMVGSRFVSDRYAHFWLGIQQRAAKTDPTATVIGYAYFNYFQAPTGGIKLNPNILLGYCPSGGFFPRSQDEHEWMKQQWDGWHATGARLFMRTNHLLDGYCMPFIFAHQFADVFRHAVSHGMVATDFDSLTGEWATQGPNLYVATRLHVRPEASADEVLAEYYAAFGPAAVLVKRYFDYWEDYTTSNRKRLTEAMETLQASRWRSWAKTAHVVFPPECFSPAETMLAEAGKAAASDQEAATRVEFLKLGLLHAKLCARVSASLTLANPTASKDETKRLLDEVIVFRRKAEHSGIGNFNHLAWVEDLSWKMSDEAKKAPDLYP
jgi:hypothetical protein